MNEIQAALGISQIKKLKKLQNKRKKIANLYNRLFKGNLKIEIPLSSKIYESSLHLYVIKIKKERDNILIRLRKKGIYTNVHYLPIHLHPFFKKLGFKKNQFPNSEKYGREALSIPIYPNLNFKDQIKVINEIKKLVLL